MAESKRQLLSIGVFLLIIVAVIVLFAANLVPLADVVPLILVLSGLWFLALAAMRNQAPMKYERGAFSTLNMGLLLIAVGGAWYLYYINWLYSVALVLLVLGAIAIVAALKRSK
jgi:hypothetical protein